MSSTFRPTLFYRDPLAALSWLEEAFGFETTLLVTDSEGRASHVEMRFGDGVLSLGAELESRAFLGSAVMKSPASLKGQGTQFVRVSLDGGIDEHCRRAETAGAQIVQRPENQFYGARVYRALDPEGHVWAFEQEMSEVSIPEMERASGLKIQASL